MNKKEILKWVNKNLGVVYGPSNDEFTNIIHDCVEDIGYKWVSIDERPPEEEKEMNTLWFDVWVNNFRVADVKFRDGEFYAQIEDHDGDYSHDEKLSNVTHWMEIKPPTN